MRKKSRHTLRNKDRANYFAPHPANLASMAAAAGAIDDPTMQNLVRAALLTNDPKVIRDASEYLDHLMVEQALNPNPFDEPTSEDLDGDFYIGGKTPSGIPVNLKLNMLKQNILITGQIGTGKTITLKNIIHSLYDKNILFRVFDLVGGFSDIPKIYRNVIPIRIGEDPFENIFNSPPSMSTQDWDNILLEIHSQVFGLMMGSQSFELDLNGELRDLFKTSSESHSTKDLELYMEHLWRKLKFKPSSPQYKYLGVCKGRWRYFNQELGKSFNLQKGLMEKLRDKNVVFYMQGKSEYNQSFIFLYDFFWEAYERICNPAARGKMVVRFVDESEPFFHINLEKRYQENPPRSRDAIKLSRQLLIPVCIANQSLSNLMSSVTLYTGTHIFFKNRSKDDLFNIAKSHMLNEDHITEITRFNPGECVVMLSGGYPKPFRLNMDYFDSSSMIDPEIEKYNNRLLEDLKKEIVPQSTFLIKKLDKERKISILLKDEENMLIHVAKFPLDILTKRYYELGFTTNRGKKISRALENKGFINIFSIVSGRGGRISLCELTQRARNWLSEKNIDFKKIEGRGSLIHKFWINRWAIHFEKQGFSIKTEEKISNVVADLLLMKGDLRYAFEFMHKSKPEEEINKVQEYFRIGLNGVLIVSDDRNKLKEIKKKAKSILSKEHLANIRFKPVYDCMKDSV